MANMNFSWIHGSPEQLARMIHSFANQVPNVVADIASSEASRAEAHMKETARWTDRTANARQGLFGASEQTATGARVVLGGTMDYQPYLELGTRRMAPRAIIAPTQRMFAPILAREVGLGLMEMFAP